MQQVYFKFTPHVSFGRKKQLIIDFFAGTAGKKTQGSLRESLEELEKHLIGEAMDKAGDNQTRAAEILGMSERMLRYKLKKYELKN